jgi:hypothetical protein
MKTIKKKPLVKIDKDELSFSFSTSINNCDEWKYCVEIEGKIESLYLDEEIGTVRLTQLNLGKAMDAGDDFRDLIDSVDDDLLQVCEPLVNTKCRAELSKDFEDMMDDHGNYSVPSLMIISKVGIYKKFRGNNLLGSILGLIEAINPGAVLVAHPFPLQYNGNEDNLKIMGIKSEKKATRQKRMDDQNRLVRHYESHGFKRLGNTETWVKIP